MEPMTYKQMAEITGKSTRTLRWFSKQHSIAPITPGGAYKPATFDPAPFLEHYAADKTKPRKKSGPKPKKDKVIQDKPGEETQAHYEEAAEYPAVAPPLPVLTPELIYAFKDVFGPTGTISVLRNNYGLNDIS